MLLCEQVVFYIEDINFHLARLASLTGAVVIASW